jgi:large repetitive protein
MTVSTDRVIRSDQGDTLLEVLIAVLVIALTVTALMGALLTTITSSTQQKSLSTLDSLLTGFAQSVENEVQGKAQQQPLFVNCPSAIAPGVVSPYQVLSAPVPAVGPPSTQVTVFLSGWAPGSVSATVGGLAPSSYVGSTTVPANGDLALSFDVPTLPNGPQPVVVKEGASSVTAPTSFVFANAASSGTPSLTGYTMEISSVEQWDPRPQPPTFDNAAPCVASGVQRITASATNQATGITANISFVVFGAAQTTVTIAYEVPPSPPTPSLNDTLTFQATVIPPNNTTAPATGTITWNFAGSPGNPNCSGSVNDMTALSAGGGNTGKATCTITKAPAGNYVITAGYGGDANYHAANSPTLQQKVLQASVTMGVSAAPANPVPGAPLTFTATVTPPAGDPTPNLTDTVTWTFANSPGTPQCAGTNGSNITTVTQGGGNTVKATCTVTSASAGTYTVTAAYSGDTNYFNSSAPPFQATVSKVTPTVTVSSAFTQGNTHLTFTATVSPPAGDPVPTGTVSWAFTASPGNPTCNTSNLAGNPAQATCLVNPAQLGTYTVTATYNGNVSYNTAVSAPASASLPAGVDIQGVPNNPADGIPNSGDKIVYTFNQTMDASSIANQQWNNPGNPLAVFASFSRQGSVTTLTVCKRLNCNSAVNLGSVTLGDTGATHYTSGFGSVILNATMTMVTNGTNQSVVTLTLGSVAQGGGLNPVVGTTTLTWTPDNAATSTGGTPCSTNPVPESAAPKANF